MMQLIYEYNDTKINIVKLSSRLYDVAMNRSDLKEMKLPDEPGVYYFRAHNKVLYVGKATTLRDRVRSYFSNDLLTTRGKHIVDMVTLATGITWKTTDSALEALVLEAAEIKRLKPEYNTKVKDDKSWNYVAITDEEYPRVILIRERNMFLGGGNGAEGYKKIFGPFTQGGSIAEALRIIRKIFPYRDACVPNSGKPCFNRQLGLCPGVCTGEITRGDYLKVIRNISLFLEGKKISIVRGLEREMRARAERLDFEGAGECKRTKFALEHINDVKLIKEETREISRRTSGKRERAHRIEAYDIAHISGKHSVGVMVVMENGRPARSEYRKFRLRIAPDRSDDTLHLAEVVTRRFGHSEWPEPDLVVVDGGKAQKARVEKTLRGLGKDTPVVSVVKDRRHRQREILGNKELSESYRRGILSGNLESHRFAVEYHRALRDRIPRDRKKRTVL